MKMPTVSIVSNTSIYVVRLRLPLIAALQSAGYKVAVISPVDHSTHEITAAGAAHYPISMDQYGMNPFAEMRMIQDIEVLLRKIRPCVSLHYTIKPNIFGTLAAARTKTPVINNIAGAGRAFQEGNPLLRHLVSSLFRRALRHASTVFFQNNEDKQLFVAGKMVEPSKAVRLPGSGVDLETFSLQPMPSNEKTKFLFVGRLLLEKGIADFLEAADTVNNARPLLADFEVAGEHEDRRIYIDKARLEVAAKRNEIAYHGVVAPSSVRQLLAGADCVVLPSYYREGVPRSLLEASAVGRPIITTDNVGCRDVVEHEETGFIVPPRDPAALAVAMVRFIDCDPAMRSSMGAKARRKMEREFDERLVIAEYMNRIHQHASVHF